MNLPSGSEQTKNPVTNIVTGFLYDSKPGQLRNFNRVNRALLCNFLDIMLRARIGLNVSNTVGFYLKNLRTTLLA